MEETNITTQRTIKPIFGYDDGKILYFLYRDQSGEKKIKTIEDFEWYFYLPESELDKSLGWLRETLKKAKERGTIDHIKKESPFLKIYCAGSQSIIDVRLLIGSLKKNKVDIREADLSLTKRYMIDNSLEIDTNLKYLFFDIETNDKTPGIEIGRDEIVSWAACDFNKNEYFQVNENITDENSEIKLIKDLIRLFLKYDLIIGWNSRQFDFEYIKKRIEKLNIKTKEGKLLYESSLWKRFMHLDLMERFIKLFGPSMVMLGLPGFSLNDVAKTFLGKEKIERNEKIIWLYENNQEKLKKYNIKDSVLLYELNEKLGTLPLMFKECQWTGTFMNRFYIGELLDNYILREAKKQKFYLKTSPSFTEAKEIENVKVKGAFVMEPKTGLYENIKTFDFKSMYPSIIVGWNIGQESLVEDTSEAAKNNFKEWIAERNLDNIDYSEWDEFLRDENKKFNPDKKFFQTANNQYFKKDRSSIIAGLIKRLLEERKSYKKAQLESEYNSLEYKNAQASQEAVKEMANSMFGITADKQSRFFDPRIAEAITLTGQYINRSAMDLLTKMGYSVIYGDTDSIFTIIKDDNRIDEIAIDLNKALSRYLSEIYSITDNIISIEYEKKFRKFLMLDKKRYSGHLTEIDRKKVDTIYSKGTENVRKDTIEFTRRKFVECLDLILKKDKNLIFMIDWVKNLKKLVFLEVVEGKDLSISKKVSKPISEYKSKPPHIRLAEKMIKSKEILETQKGKHTWGEKIEYIVTDNDDKEGLILSRNFENKWDRNYYWQVQIYAPIYRLLCISFPEHDWIQYDEVKVIKRTKKRRQLKLF